MMLDAAAVGQAFTSVPLRSVGRFVRGITFKPDDVINTSDTTAVFCMRTKNVQADLDLSDVWGIPSAFVKREEQFLQPGDILVSSANSWNLIGKCCWIPSFERRATFGGFVSVLRADPEQVEPRYLYRWFASDPVQAKLRSFGRQTTNISNLDLERCLAMQLPLPPLSEQRRIAAILDQADALRAKRRAALAQLDEMARAIFVDMFGEPIANPKAWPVSSLSSLSYRIQIGPFGSQLHEEDYIAGGVPLINPTHLKAGKIRPDWSLTVPSEKYKQLSQYHLAKGDLIMGRRGEMGRCAVVSSAEHGWLCGTGSLFVRPHIAKLNLYYLDHLISSSSMRGFLQNVAQGVTMANLNKDIVGSLPIPLPPKELQDKFANSLAEVEILRANIDREVLILDTLFASLQHRAFRGEL